MKKYFYIVIFCVLILLTGCNIVGQTIQYDHTLYTYVWNWEMTINSYQIIDIKENGQNIKCRRYDNDLNCEFLIWDMNGSVYHKTNSSFPNNNIIDIQNLIIRAHNKNISTNISNENVIKDFVNIISSDSYNSLVEYKDNLCTIAIEYKNYPAICCYGNILLDNNGTYWLRVYTESIKESIYYKLNSQSLFLNESLQCI